jgi:hypothetical protein
MISLTTVRAVNTTSNSRFCLKIKLPLRFLSFFSFLFFFFVAYLRQRSLSSLASALVYPTEKRRKSVILPSHQRFQPHPFPSSWSCVIKCVYCPIYKVLIRFPSTVGIYMHLTTPSRNGGDETTWQSLDCLWSKCRGATAIRGSSLYSLYYHHYQVRSLEGGGLQTDTLWVNNRRRWWSWYACMQWILLAPGSVTRRHYLDIDTSSKGTYDIKRHMGVHWQWGFHLWRVLQLATWTVQEVHEFHIVMAILCQAVFRYIFVKAYMK